MSAIPMAELTIDLNQIKTNILQIKSTTGTRILLAAKSNAYGLGAVPICQHVAPVIDYIGVISVQEALPLRAAGIDTPILLLREPVASEFSMLHSENIMVTVFQKTTIQSLHAYASKNQVSIKTHFKIDTGMSRLGHSWDTVSATLTLWLNSSLKKEGIYTHFANSEDSSHAMTAIQLNRFNDIVADMPYLKHCANSGAIQSLPSSCLDMVRLGLSAYENTFFLRAPLIAIKHISAGRSIGYGSTYTCTEDQTVGVIAIGYADGIPSQLSNNGYVIIHGFNCPIVGRICMDMMMVRLPNDSSFSDGDMATIISPTHASGMSLNELANLVSFNPRELMTNVSNRVHRHYINQLD